MRVSYLALQVEAISELFRDWRHWTHTQWIWDNKIALNASFGLLHYSHLKVMWTTGGARFASNFFAHRYPLF